MVSQYVGEYFTKDWVMKNVLKLSEEDIKDLEDKVDDENAEKEREMEDEQPDQQEPLQPEAPEQAAEPPQGQKNN